MASSRKFRVGLILGLCLLLVLAAGLEFGASSLADCAETTRHLFFFRALFFCLCCEGTG